MPQCFEPAVREQLNHDQLSHGPPIRAVRCEPKCGKVVAEVRSVCGPCMIFRTKMAICVNGLAYYIEIITIFTHLIFKQREIINYRAKLRTEAEQKE